MSTKKYKNLILGIWDIHDSGAAILDGQNILYAANEERFTRRKLEIAFPTNSILKGLAYLKLKPRDIKCVAFTTSDPAKTLQRIFPSLKERYYKIRRKKVYPSPLTKFQDRFKYFFTEFKPNFISRSLSEIIIRRKLAGIGISPNKIMNVDHHLSHAYGAYMASPFTKCLAITLDGLGDGLSGTVSKAKDGKIELIHKQSAKHSLGIFYEHATSLLNMRRLEDEGKVMALVDFSLPIKTSDNPLIDFFSFDKGRIISKYSNQRMLKKLQRVFWQHPLERFAYLTQKTLEYYALKFVRYWVEKTDLHNVVFAGGIAANIKLNHRILELDEVKDLFIFPHMGDGGLAFGAAAYAANKDWRIKKLNFKDCFLGPNYSDEEIEAVLESQGLSYQKVNPAVKGAQLIKKREILLWFQGRMEFGPRALGHRSILALPDSQEVKDDLNLKIKKRVWYQPFCPSMLLEDARRVFEQVKGTPNEFMTCGYFVKKKYRENLKGVINVDGSCRPQIALKHNRIYYDLLKELKKRTGYGIVLNTSFNLHGEPIVNTPKDALEVFKKSDVNYIILGNYLVPKKGSKK